MGFWNAVSELWPETRRALARYPNHQSNPIDLRHLAPSNPTCQGVPVPRECAAYIIQKLERGAIPLKLGGISGCVYNASPQSLQIVARLIQDFPRISEYKVGVDCLIPLRNIYSALLKIPVE